MVTIQAGWGQRAPSRFLTAPHFLFLTGEQGWWNSLFFDSMGNFPTPSLSYSLHDHSLLLSGMISALWAQEFVWCSRHQIYSTLSEWPKEARSLLLKTPLARMTKGSLSCRHKGWEREEGTRSVRSDTVFPSQQHTAGVTVLRVQGTAVNLLRARKEIDTAVKGWPAFVEASSCCELRGSPSQDSNALLSRPPPSDGALVYVSY